MLINLKNKNKNKRNHRIFLWNIVGDILYWNILVDYLSKKI